MTTTTDATESRTGVRWRLSWCVVLTVVVLWPFAVAVVAGWDRDSALLLRDLSVPGSMALNDLATGADGLARAVPQDAVLAFLSPVLPPTVVVGLLMCACGAAGAWGATVLAQRFGAGRVGQALASFLVVWNPYVAERLLQGHWSVVAAGMLLPLVAWLSLERRRVWLVVALAVCALTPTGLILAVVTAVVASGWRLFSLVPVVAGAALSLPWVIPSLGDASATLTDAAGASLFAARAEPWVGTLGALAGLGGIWNADAVPVYRLPVAGALLAVVAVAVATVLCRRGELSPGLMRLSALSAGAVLLPALLATGPGLAVLGEVLENVPGAGLVRDTQKFVVLALPAMVALLARADVLLPRVTRGLPVPLFRLVALLSVAALSILQVPALPVDVAELRPVSLDRGYTGAVSAVKDAGGGRTLLWPPGNYRVINGRPVLDPLLKMLPGAPVDPGYLVVDGRIVDGNPETVRLLSDIADGHDGLAQAGVDLVLVSTGAAQQLGVGVPTALTDDSSPHRLLWSDDGWELYRVS